MARSEVTNAQYEQCVKAGACSEPTFKGRLPASYRYLEKLPRVWSKLPCMRRAPAIGAPFIPPPYDTWRRPDHDEHPVVCITYEQAAQFAAWVGGRLPTEAEWEYAARGGDHRERNYPWKADKIDDSYACIRSGRGPNGPSRVCSFKKGHSDEGMCDLVGNVYEWTLDGFGSYQAAPREASEPQAAISPKEMVIRGGSWDVTAKAASAVARAAAHRDLAYYWLGFRPVRNGARLQAGAAHAQAFLLHHRSPFQRRALWSPNHAWQRYSLYRIPALLRTAHGTLLVVAEGRLNDHDFYGTALVMLRSHDDGTTWTAEQDVLPRARGLCLNTPLLLQGSDGGAVRLFFSEGEVGVGNYNTHAMHVVSSSDDGRTWSKPRLVAKGAKPGPGHGVQLALGPKRGRLIVPARGEDPSNQPDLSVFAIFSDDGGNTWKSGVRGSIKGNENQMLEAKNGSLLTFMRSNCQSDEFAPGKRFARSDDGGESWRPAQLSDTLLESFAGCGTMTAPGRNGKRVWLYSCPPMAAKDCGDHSARRSLTVRLSEDEGASWPYALVIDEGISGYSDMALGRGGLVHIVYERGDQRFDEEIVHTTFSLEDVYSSPISPQAVLHF